MISLKIKVQPKLKKKILFLIILCSIFLFNVCFQEFDSGNHLVMNDLDNLKTSAMKGLNPDDFAELHGYADQYVDWSFSTLPSQTINVWALDPFQYSLFTSGIPASGYLLSTSSSGSGRLNVPEGNTWYIVFWNDEIGSQYTIVSYTANFVGDSRPPSITVKKPSSTSTYQTGSNQVIEWSTQGSVGNLKIELYKGTSLFSTVISSTSNDGQHNWKVPGNCPQASDYRIKITYISNPSVNDYSSYFDIIEFKSIIILDPTNGSEVIPKTTHTIKWESTGSIGDVRIELYKGPSLLKEIKSRTDNDGSYSWVPCYYEKGGYSYYKIPEGSDYRIKIRDLSSSTYNFSKYFTITNFKSLTVLEPNSTSSYKHGETMTIRWETDTPCETIIIKVYYRPPGQAGADQKLILSDIPNIGYYNWTIPMDLPHGNSFYFVVEATDKSVHEFSDNFTIGDPLLNAVPSYSLTLIIGVFLLMAGIYIHQHLKKFKREHLK